MIARKKITLVIPCRNEEKALAMLIKRVPKSVDEILVIDNKSRDKTALVARKLGARVFRETRHVDGIGYGFAHQTGIAKATGDIILTVDGDNTYPVKAIPAIVKYMVKNNLDVVSCNRFPLHDKTVISPIRQLGVWILNTQVRMLYGYQMQDILTGMWAIRREVAQSLNLTEGGWDFSPEIKLEALSKLRQTFGEFHIEHEYRAEGLSKQQIWKTGFSHLYYIAKRWLIKDSFIARNLPELRVLHNPS